MKNIDYLLHIRQVIDQYRQRIFFLEHNPSFDFAGTPAYIAFLKDEIHELENHLQSTVTNGKS